MPCHSLLILSRNTLLISKEATSAVADIIAKDKPWGSAVRNGQSIAANAARKILRILVETLDSYSISIFSSWLGMLHAFATLAIHIVTHPGSRISTMDFHVSCPRSPPVIVSSKGPSRTQANLNSRDLADASRHGLSENGGFANV